MVLGFDCMLVQEDIPSNAIAEKENRMDVNFII
jgi:hypothetical protein